MDRALDVYLWGSYPPRICGIGTFQQDLAAALRGRYPTEIRSINVVAIDNGLGEEAYRNPAITAVVDQKNPRSWLRAAGKVLTRANEIGDDIATVIFNHEFGLDGTDAKGDNYARVARILRQADLPIFTYLHTVLREPEPYQSRIIQELGENSDKLIVTTDTAIEVLSKKPYDISRNKIQRIDHGIRVHEQSTEDRHNAKVEFKLENIFLLTTLGLKSNTKGLEYAIQGFAQFVRKLNRADRRNILYVIAGRYHPEFMEASGGEDYRAYKNKIRDTIKNEGLECLTTTDLRSVSREHLENHDLIIYEQFLTPTDLIKMYAASDAILITPKNRQQMSSGILADGIGSGRVVICPKFDHATHLIAGKSNVPPGLIGKNDPDARGLLIDYDGINRDEPNVKQIAEALEYVVSNRNARLLMEAKARARGITMTWDNGAREIFQEIQITIERRGLSREREIELRTN